MSNIEINSEYKKLLDEVERLTEKLTDLIQERDYLLYQENPRIKARYISVIGRIQLEVFNIEIEVLRLKRVIEIYQMLINKQQEIDETKIEEIIEKEYEEYTYRIIDLQEELNTAEFINNQKPMNEKDSKEFKTIYRELIKKLHPDLDNSNLELTEEEKEEKEILLQNVITAYETGDLETMRALHMVVESKDFISAIDFTKSSIDILREKKENLEKSILEIKEEIKDIKSEYPYNTLELLEDDEKLLERQELLKKQIDEYKEAKEELEKIFNEIKKG